MIDSRSGLQPDDGLIHLAALHRLVLAGCVVHRAVDVVPTVRVRRVSATGLARTVVDCAHMLAFREAVVLIDVDGPGKYDELGELQREKQRQNALVAAGYTVLRFGWADVTYRPGPTVALVRGALAG